MDSSSENKREKNTESEWPRNEMDFLPREVSLDILSRVPITSLIRFRYVSKSWKNLSYDPHLINLHFSRSAKNSTCLIFHCSGPSGNHLRFVEFSDHNEKEVVRKFNLPGPVQLSEINVVGSCNGLICLSNSKNHDIIQIFNPFTRSYKQLPESRQFDDQKVLVGFGFHPLTNEYKVLRIVYYLNVNDKFPHPHRVYYLNVNDKFPHPHRVRRWVRYVYSQSEVQVYSVGSNGWRCIGKMPYQIEPRMSESLFVNGRLHWLTRTGNARKIISFDLADEQFREVPAPEWAGIRTFPYPFAVLRGCLSLVLFPRDRNIEIWVMKEYGVRDSWTKDFEIDVNDPIPSSPLAWAPSIQSLAIRVLCLTENGGILLMRNGELASYDPESRELKNVMFEGIRKCLQIIVHIGSLVCIENV